MMKQQPTRLRFANYCTIFFFFSGLFWAPSVFGQVSGTVFRDYNANGQKDANEPLVEGIVVNAFNTTGALCATVTTAGSTAPNYTLPTGCSGDLRIEFTIPSNICTANPSVDYSAPSGSVNGSSVQFVAPNGTANFAIADPSEYVSPTLTNPKLFTVCYVSGNNLGAGNVGAADAFISVDYNPTSDTTPTPAHFSNTAQIGSTWGVAFSKQANKLFTSAVLKRHSGLGPLGSGGIYMIDPTKQLPDLTGTTDFLDFDALGIATQGAGSYAGQSVAGPVIPFSPIIGSNTDRGLGTNLNSGERDAQAVAQSGRVSFGDIDISDDGRYLYVVNLFDRKLYEMDLTNPKNPVTPTLSQIQSWTIPNDCNGAKGTARPWSIGIHKGKVYVGVVCDANISQDKADLNFTIYELNRTTGTFTTIVSNTLDFPRGLANGFIANGSSRKGWFAWTDDWNKITAGTTAITWPQPILSDIEFDTDGSLILGFIDRLGLQGGWFNKSPLTGDSTLYSTIIGGDLLRGYKKPDCTWEVESAGKEGPSSPKPATGGATNGEGPGGGEFYYEDFYASQHQETALGGLALLRGSGDVVSTIYDPFTYDSFGVGWFDNTTGKKDKGYQVYVTGSSGQTPTSGTFSKGLTLGDIEIENEPAPLEIGNRIFNDTDSDGIQDAGEAGIDGVTVKLFEGATEVGSTTTANGGQYYFTDANVTGGVKYNTAYEIRIEAAQAPLSTLSLTTTDAGSSDLIDSDGTTSGANAIKSFTTGNAGENNHSYDFGFKAPCDTTLTVTNTTICNGTTVDLFSLASGVKGSLTYSTNGTTWTALTNPTNVTPSVTTTYYIKDTLVSGCFDIDTLVITVNPQPTTPSVSSPIMNICPLTTVDLTTISSALTPSVSGSVFEWHVSNSSSSAMVSNQNTVGAGDYYLFERSPAGCYSTGLKVTTTINVCCPPKICIRVTITRKN